MTISQLIEFVSNHWGLSLALLAVLSLLVGGEIQRRLSGIRDVGPIEAVRLGNQDDALLLDVREEAEYKDGLLPNAVLLPMSKLAERISELDSYRGRPLITVCRSGQRSRRACSLLQKQGFETVYNLGGGIAAWQNANLPLNTHKNKK